MARWNSDAVRNALEALRQAEEQSIEYANVDPAVRNVLEASLGILWRRILDESPPYVMNDLEFRLFNYFRRRFDGDERARRAIERYWWNTRNHTDR